jgi:hypothetical protein
MESLTHGTTVQTPNAGTARVIRSYEAMNGRHYTLVRMLEATKYVERKYLTARLTVIDDVS